MNSNEKSVDSTALQAIDVHGHAGIYCGSKHPLLDEFFTGGIAAVRERAQTARIEITLVSALGSLLPRGNADPVRGNQELEREIDGSKYFRQWIVVDPRIPETFEQAMRMIKDGLGVGIKIHPEEHRYHIKDYGRTIFEFAARNRFVILSHSGELNSLPADFVPWADAYPETTLILGHLGFGHNADPTLQVRAIQQSKHGNIFADTSSSCSLWSNMIEWAVKQVGADKLCFGTDAPLYDSFTQRARIDAAGITPDEKRKILRGNSLRIFNMH